MCHIVGDLSKYVPSVNDSEEEPSAATTSVVQLLFFGDQLTVERARGAMVLRSFHEEAVDRLEGFVPAVADWHARMTLVKVCRFHKCCMYLMMYVFPLCKGYLGQAVLN